MFCPERLERWQTEMDILTEAVRASERALEEEAFLGAETAVSFSCEFKLAGFFVARVSHVILGYSL